MMIDIIEDKTSSSWNDRMWYFLILVSVLILIIIISTRNKCDKESYKNYGNYQNYSIKTREEKIDDTNERRCNEGRFYVNCHSCGRKRVIEELYGRKPKTGCDMMDNENKKCNSKFCKEDCPSCKNRFNNTMSFYNDNYVDTDQIFCYNCLLDRYFPPDGVTKTPFAKNYIYWPSLEDPNNGVPYS